MGTKYGTLRQQQDVKREIEHLDNVAKDPYLFGTIANKQEFLQRQAKMHKTHEAIAVPAIASDNERRRLEARQAQLEEFMVGADASIRKPEMPSQHQMWGTPAGAIGQHRAWENAVKNYNIDHTGAATRNPAYGAVAEWKDNQRKLHGEEEEIDPDIANVERIRPQSRPHTMAGFRKMQFAPGASVSEEDWEERVGPAKPRKLRKPWDGPTCDYVKADGSVCGAPAKKNGRCFSKHHARKEEEEKQDASPATSA